MQYIILDTNVIVSALMAERDKVQSKPLQVIGIVFSNDKDYIPVYDEEIANEYKSVLERPVFNLKKMRIGKFLNDLKKIGTNIKRIEIDDGFNFPDPKDIVFYEVTMAARKKKDSLLVTGNLKHYPIKKYIISPDEFLQLFHGKKIEEIRDTDKAVYKPPER